jgi:hypothetical protein
MKATRSVVLLVTVLLLATGCSPPNPPTVASTQAQLCQDLAELDQALKAIPPVTSSTTVGEVKAAAQRVRTSWNDVKQSAGNVGQALVTELQSLETAENDLDRSVTSAVANLPDDATLGEAARQLLPRLQAVSDARASAASRAQCGS